MPDLATTADDDDDSSGLLQQQKPEEVAAASSTATATTKLASVRRMLGAICVLATLVMVLAALSPSVAVAKCIPADSKHSSFSSTTSTTTLSLSEAASLSSPPRQATVSNGTNVSGADGGGGTELVKLARGLLWASVGIGALRLISFFTFSHTNKIRAFYCVETAANIAFCVLLISALMIISGWSNRSIVIASPRNGHHHHHCRLDTKGSLCGWLLIASIGISSLLLPFDIFELIDTRDSYTRVPLEELNLPRRRPKGGGGGGEEEAGEDGVTPPPPRSPERVFAIAEDEEEEENEGKKDCSEISML